MAPCGTFKQGASQTSLKSRPAIHLGVIARSQRVLAPPSIVQSNLCVGRITSVPFWLKLSRLKNPRSPLCFQLRRPLELPAQDQFGTLRCPFMSSAKDGLLRWVDCDTCLLILKDLVLLSCASGTANWVQAAQHALGYGSFRLGIYAARTRCISTVCAKLQCWKGRVGETHIGVSRGPQTLWPSGQRLKLESTPLGEPQTSFHARVALLLVCQNRQYILSG